MSWATLRALTRDVQVLPRKYRTAAAVRGTQKWTETRAHAKLMTDGHKNGVFFSTLPFLDDGRVLRFLVRPHWFRPRTPKESSVAN